MDHHTSNARTLVGISLTRQRALADAVAAESLVDLPWAEPVGEHFAEPGTIVDDRYELIRHIGQGAFGAVYEVEDSTSGERVALKVLTVRVPALVERMAREISVLRRLDLPGVIGFLDEGVWGEHPFVVMPLVAGDYFPGPVTERSWRALGGRIVALFESVARVHHAGVLHRDLKPANVLWMDERPMVLDFGLAVSHQLVVGNEDLAGTPAYLAPEQYYGEEPDERSDLFSLGVMAYDLLAGRKPFEGELLHEVVASVLQSTPAPLSSCADVPEAVGAILDSMIAREPGDRPPSAAEVVRQLVRHLPAVPGSQLNLGSAPRSAAELEELFAGPECIHHLKTDPAQVLWSRTGGWPRAVQRTVDCWVRAGICTRTESGLALSRARADRLLQGMPVDPCRAWELVPPPLTPLQERVWSAVDVLSPWSTAARVGQLLGEADVSDDLEVLARLGLLAVRAETWFSVRTPPRLGVEDTKRIHRDAAAIVPEDSPERVEHLLLADELERVAAAALVVGREQARKGRYATSWAVVREGIAIERRLGAQNDALMVLAAEVALAGNSPGWLGLVTLEANRRSLAAIGSLCRAGREVLQGGKPALESIEVAGWPSLELWRLRLSAYSYLGRPIDEHRAWVLSVREAADGLESGGASWQGWWSRVLYREGRFGEAAEANEQALATDLPPERWVSVALNTAGMWLETGAFDRVKALLTQLEDRVPLQRIPAHEAYTMYMDRQLSYRQGEVLDRLPDFEAGLAAMDAPLFIAPMIMNEAAHSWRRGDLELADTLAAVAAEGWQRGGRAWAWAFARAFQWMVGGHEPDAAEVDEVLAASSDCEVPGVACQIWLAGLRCGVDLRPKDWAVLKKALNMMDYPPEARREVFSLVELTHTLGEPP